MGAAAPLVSHGQTAHTTSTTQLSSEYSYSSSQDETGGSTCAMESFTTLSRRTAIFTTRFSPFPPVVRSNSLELATDCRPIRPSTSFLHRHLRIQCMLCSMSLQYPTYHACICKRYLRLLFSKASKIGRSYLLSQLRFIWKIVAVLSSPFCSLISAMSTT